MAEDGHDKEDGPDLRARRLPGEVLGLGLNVVASAFLFGYAGRWVGTKVGGVDYWTLLGGFIGAAAGFYSLYLHLTSRSQDREKKKSG